MLAITDRAATSLWDLLVKGSSDRSAAQPTCRLACSAELAILAGICL
jgi:hypothetical protein